MHRITFALLILFISTLCFSQSQWKVGLDMGPTWPISDYNNFDYSNENSGFAARGFKLNFDASYFLNSRVALSGRMLMGSNTMDDKELYDQLLTTLEEYLPEDPENVFYDLGSWTWTGILVGPKWAFPIVRHKVYGELAIYSGVQFTQTPEMGISYDNKDDKMYYRTSSDDNKHYNLPLSLVAALRFPINDRISLYTGFEYYRSQVKFGSQTILFNRGTNDFEVTNEISHAPTIQSIQTSIGLVYTLF